MSIMAQFSRGRNSPLSQRMSEPNYSKPPSEVPTQVFEQFIKTLEETKIAATVVKRLRGLLLSDKSLSEKAVSEALLSDDQLP